MPKLEPPSPVAPNLAGNKDPASIAFFFFFFFEKTTLFRKNFRRMIIFNISKIIQLEYNNIFNINAIIIAVI